MITYLLWMDINKTDLTEYALPMVGSLLTLPFDFLMLPLELITIIVWKVRNR